MESLAPIALFVFKRPDLTKQTIEALLENQLSNNSVLYIFSDAAKTSEDKEKVNTVRKYIRSISGFKQIYIFESETNKGLANSIIAGVTQVINKHGKIIVLEDDMVTSPFFLNYMNDGLNFYKDEDSVISIHGYIYPVKQTLPDTFFLRGADCWGWGTWKRGWELFEQDAEKLLIRLKEQNLEREFDLNNSFNNIKMLKNQIKGKVDSWAIRWHASAFLNDKLTLYPGKSLIQNIGFSSEATHTSTNNIYQIELWKNPIEIKTIPIKENIEARLAIERFFKNNKRSLIQKIIDKVF